MFVIIITEEEELSRHLVAAEPAWMVEAHDMEENSLGLMNIAMVYLRPEASMVCMQQVVEPGFPVFHSQASADIFLQVKDMV